MALLERIVRLGVRIVGFLALAGSLVLVALVIRWLAKSTISPEPTLKALGELIGPLIEQPAFKIAMVSEVFVEVVVFFVLTVHSVTKSTIRMLRGFAAIWWDVSEGTGEPQGVAVTSAIIFVAGMFLAGSVLKIKFLK